MTEVTKEVFFEKVYRLKLDVRLFSVDTTRQDWKFPNGELFGQIVKLSWNQHKYLLSEKWATQ